MIVGEQKKTWQSQYASLAPWLTVAFVLTSYWGIVCHSMHPIYNWVLSYLCISSPWRTVMVFTF